MRHVVQAKSLHLSCVSSTFAVKESVEVQSALVNQDIATDEEFTPLKKKFSYVKANATKSDSSKGKNAASENQFDPLASLDLADSDPTIPELDDYDPVDPEPNDSVLVVSDVVHHSPRKMRAAAYKGHKLVHDIKPQRRKSKGKKVQVRKLTSGVSISY